MTACLQTDATSMPVTSRQAANGKAERKKSTKTFHTQLDPRWPDLQSPSATEITNISKLKKQSSFNSRHRALPLNPTDPGTEVYIKDLQRLDIS